MQLDPRSYLSHVAHFDMSEERKIELIETVSRIMQSFVERAFGEAPEQTFLGIDADPSGDGADDRLELDHSLISTFKSAAREDAGRKSSP